MASERLGRSPCLRRQSSTILRNEAAKVGPHIGAPSAASVTAAFATSYWSSFPAGRKRRPTPFGPSFPLRLGLLTQMRVLGIEYLPRNKQRRPAEPSLRVVENTDCTVSLPEEDDAPSLWGDEHSYDMHSLLEENACCEGFWLKWISSSKRSLTQSNVASVYARTVTICGSARAAK